MPRLCVCARERSLEASPAISVCVLCVCSSHLCQKAGAWGSRRRVPVRRRQSPPNYPPFSGWCALAPRAVFSYSLAHAHGHSDTSSVAARVVCGRRGALAAPPAAPPRPSSTWSRKGSEQAPSAGCRAAAWASRCAPSCLSRRADLARTRSFSLRLMTKSALQGRKRADDACIPHTHTPHACQLRCPHGALTAHSRSTAHANRPRAGVLPESR